MNHADPHQPPRNEALLWGWAWIAINGAVLVGVGVRIPIFQKMSRALGLPRSREFIFYAVAAIAMGNAIRRIILQWRKLQQLYRDGT